MNQFVITAIVSLSILFSVRAMAQEVTTQTKDEQAREEFQKGQALFEKGDYKNALEQFEKSYELSRRAPLLMSIASCEDRLGKVDEAIIHYEAFLATRHQSLEATKNARSRLSILKAQQAKQLAIKKGDGATMSKKPKPLQPAVEEEPKKRSMLGPAILMGVGGATALGSLAFSIQANNLDTDLSAACAGGICPENLRQDVDRMKTQALVSDIMLIGGSALLVGGVIWMVINMNANKATDSKESATRLNCGFQQCVVSGHF